MIYVGNNLVTPDKVQEKYPINSLERKMIDILSTSSEVYRYSSLEQLDFELALRKNITVASRELYRSRFSFSVFRKSRCNENLWERTSEGGFLLRDGIKPSDAILDIYRNSSAYSTECATAMVIVFYKGLLNVLPAGLFDSLFRRIYLMDWQHLDRNLGISTQRYIADYLPGDCRYFKNPDVDPLTPEWQGENVIVMGDGTYYGHGIGIKTGDQIIYALNQYRISGSQVSAYLLDGATRLDFRGLANKYLTYASQPVGGV